MKTNLFLKPIQLLIECLPLKVKTFLIDNYLNYKHGYDQILKRNQILKDKYQGKRCFIVGNGSSLNQMDLNLLQNEYVFTLNHFYLHKEIEAIKPTFYSFIEPIDEKNNFSLEKCLNALEKLDQLGQKLVDMNLFFNISYKKYIEKHRFFLKNNVYYLKSYLPLLMANNPSSDISKSHDFMDMSILNAMVCCFYMGFSNLYLIGCDFDHLLHQDEKHFYQNTTKVRLTNASNLILAESLYIYLSKMEKLREYFQNKNINIYNAGIGGFTDTFPRVKYESLF